MADMRSCESAHDFRFSAHIRSTPTAGRQHGDLKGRMSPITTPFDFHSTASDVARRLDLSGKRAIITGGAAGIGLETTRALAAAGAQITLAVRRPEAAQ